MVEAALGLVDRKGLEALSMRRLGAVLGVEAMSLYYYMPSKAVLLDALIERVFGDLRLPEPGARSFDEALRESARSYRELLLQHPNLIPVIATQQLTNPGVLRPVGAVMALLRSAGYDAASAHRILMTVVSFVTGTALWETGTAIYRGEADGTSPDAPALPPSADPYLHELLPQMATQDCDEAFEYGLEVILAGLKRSHPSGSGLVARTG